MESSYQVIIKETGTTLSEARKQWPEWYKSVVIEKNVPGTFLQNRGLYEWWLRTLQTVARQGNRYYCIAILFAMAKKTGVSYSEVYKTAEDLVLVMDGLTEPGQEHFDAKDLKCAALFYNDWALRLSAGLFHSWKKESCRIPSDICAGYFSGTFCHEAFPEL